MGSYIDTFERKEVKYRLNAQRRSAIETALCQNMVVDGYGRTRIESVYLDTPERALIVRSLEKPLYKEKLRVRSYGPIAEANEVYVEIKKKFKGIVYKRRVQMTKTAARRFLLEGVSYEDAVMANPVVSLSGEVMGLEPNNIQIAREISAFCKRYPGLAPSMLIGCERVALQMRPECEDLPAVRVTFDDDVLSLDLFADGRAAQCSFAPVTEPGESIMEVKVAGAFPLWLTDILSANKTYSSSFSKYGTAYMKLVCEGAPFTRQELGVRAFTTNERIRCA